MKSAAIVTIESINFGNRLQNYALQTMIEDLGLHVETVRRRRHASVKSALKAEAKGIAMSAMGTKGGKFRDFEKHIRKSRFYASADEADAGLADRYDFFISGSDQVWNPYYDFVGRSDLLAFARSEQRISYAASFGVSRIPDEKKDTYKELLSGFSAISVREDSGARLVKELTGRDAQVVLDPTLMLQAGQWTKLEKKPCFAPDEPYVLVYALGEKSGTFEGTLEEIQAKKDLKIVDIRGLNQRGKQLEAGPAEFIYLVHHAEMVLTDSFHATAFSLIYNKNVMTFHRVGIDMSSRIVSLADTIGLKYNFDQNGTFCMSESTDYSVVNKKLEMEKQTSLEFLKNSLTGGVLSVIIPVYNVAEYLDTCIQSVIFQTYENFELILIDDGSTDDSGEICDEWQRKDTRVRVIHQKNSGVSAARNLGLKESKGDAVIFLDADDEIEPDMFADMTLHLYEEDVDVVSCGYTCMAEENTQDRVPERGILLQDQPLQGIFTNEIFAAVWNKMFRRTAIFDNNGNYNPFLEGICNGEDIVWLAEVLSKVNRMYCIDKVLYHWRMRTRSATDNREFRIDDKALTEVYALDKVKDICRDISDDCYYLACKRYYGFLMVKAKNPDLRKNPDGLELVRTSLAKLIKEFPVRTPRELLSLQKAKILVLKLTGGGY